MAAHALLSASSSERWMRCPGSVEASKNIVDTGSSFAAEGTSAHALAEHCLNENVTPAACIGQKFEGFTVDNYMAEYVQQYIDYVLQFSGQHYYEVRVDFSPWVPDGFGTSDVIIIDPKTKTMRIIDLKYGQGVPVYADNNTQAQLYALGALNDFGDMVDIERVEIAIIQPRLDIISEWSTTVDALRVFGEKANNAALEALKPNAKRQPGEKQCQWCRAKATCPALKSYTESALLESFDNIDVDNIKPVDHLNDEQLRKVLDAKKLVLSWFEAVEDHVSKKLFAGEQFAGYKLVEGRSNRAWMDESEAEKLLAQSYTDDQLYKKSFISVAQAEKLLGKKNAAMLDDLVIKPQGKPTIAPESDKRPAIGATIGDFDVCGD
jgi:hypothetical protein